SLLFAGCIVFYFAWNLRAQSNSGRRDLSKSLLVIQILILGFLLMTQFSYLELYRFPISCYLDYKRELATFRTTQQRYASDSVNLKATKTENDEVYLVVIGESLNRNHMSLYGYPRKTTPGLEELARKHGLLAFESAYASHVFTDEALPMSLTEANQRNSIDYFHSVSVVSVFNKALVETFWITNQSLYGAYDNNVSVIAHQSGKLFPFNRWVGKVVVSRSHDAVVLEQCSQIITEKTGKSRILFVHLMGNHWMYSQRYPASFETFTGSSVTPPVENWSGLQPSLRNKVNQYDNSVLYHDFVVTSLLKRLQERGGVSAFLYFSDHGEDVFGDRQHDVSRFSFEMTRIPLLVWLSDDYRERYPEKTRAFQSHLKSLFCNDSIHDTLLGMANVMTDGYTASFDLASAEYDLPLNEAFTLHGKMRYEPESKKDGGTPVRTSQSGLSGYSGR
ncbi:MAG: phosphoethanolamine transferase, partial [Verrucomicrobiae bacterium]|nr:phosphoethanolamine transferase [Verrucomicrobiae bacterium]